MFKIPRVNVIESDEGFSVEVLGRTGVRYIEDSKELRVDSEFLVSSSALVVYKNSIRSWEPPFDNEIIDENKRASIVDNIRRAFRFQGVEIDIM
jgi:Immunity protein 74